MTTTAARKQRYRELQKFETAGTKACSICVKVKSLNDFSPHLGGRKGLQSKCKSCMRNYDRHERGGGIKSSQIVKWLELRDKEGPSEKVCKECLITKSLTEFHSNKGTDTKARKGCKAVCKQCTNIRAQKLYDAQKARKAGLKHRYNITLEEYEQAVKAQEGCCDICNKNTKLVVDHCHKTGKVRALLCNNCNGGLGFFKDNPKLLQKAAQYLESHNGSIFST